MAALASRNDGGLVISQIKAMDVHALGCGAASSVIRKERQRDILGLVYCVWPCGPAASGGSGPTSRTCHKIVVTWNLLAGC